jgi:hypothetical protein
MFKKLVLVAVLVLPGLLLGSEDMGNVLIGDITPTVLATSRSEGPDTCISDLNSPFYYHAYGQVRYEFTLAECEYARPMYVKAVVVAWFNYNPCETKEKAIEIWLTPPGTYPDCYNTNAYMVSSTTTPVPPLSCVLVQYDLPLWQDYSYKMWFGHYEIECGAPTSLWDNDYDCSQDGDDAFLNIHTWDCIWGSRCIDDNFQFIILDTLAQSDVAENTPVGDYNLNLNATSTGEIRFSLPIASEAVLKIYDAQGSLVEEITGSYAAGTHSLLWIRGANGVYFALLKADDLTATRKFVLVK